MNRILPANSHGSGKHSSHQSLRAMHLFWSPAVRVWPWPETWPEGSWRRDFERKCGDREGRQFYIRLAILYTHRVERPAADIPRLLIGVAILSLRPRHEFSRRQAGEWRTGQVNRHWRDLAQ